MGGSSPFPSLLLTQRNRVPTSTRVVRSHRQARLASPLRPADAAVKYGLVNSRVLSVTRVRPSMRAWAAMARSLPKGIRAQSEIRRETNRRQGVCAPCVST